MSEFGSRSIYENGLYEKLRSKTPRSRELLKLRSQVNAEVSRATEWRKATNPVKTPLEEDLGIYLEELEPSVRGAVERMYKLGYTTFEAGFSGIDNHQAIQGEFRLDEATKKRLKGMKVRVNEYMYMDIPCTNIGFFPERVDQEAIKAKWEQIVSALPPTGHLAHPSKTTEEFHRRVDRLLARGI